MPRARRRAGRVLVRRLTIGSTLVVLLGAGLVWASAVPASAHDQLVSTEPADGSTVPSAPSQVTATFSSKLVYLSQDMIVTTPQGERLDGLDVKVAGAQVSASLPDGLGPGQYTVTWRVVSSDGHPVQGRFVFTVAGDGPAPTASVPVVVETTSPPSVTTVSAAPSVPPAVWVGAGVVAAALLGAVAFVLRRPPR